MEQPRFLRAMALIAVGLLIAAGCGAGTDAPVDDRSAVAAAAAEVNEDRLNLTAELDTTEMLDARTGEISTLGDVLTGDRAVLLWHWAPD